MCVAAIAWDAHPELLLVAIGNRDEFHGRPAAPLARWNDGSGIIAGRDLQAGGTWLGVSEAGRFALLTNFRDPDGVRAGRASRGQLVADYLTGAPQRGMGDFNPFNLFTADQNGAQFVSNRPHVRREMLPSGIHGLSNGPIGKPWPKTRALCSALEDWLGKGAHAVPSLFHVLRAEVPRSVELPPLDAPVPDYAPIFIQNPVYGTRCSTIAIITKQGEGIIAERSFDAQGEQTNEIEVDFRWPAA